MKRIVKKDEFSVYFEFECGKWRPFHRIRAPYKEGDEISFTKHGRGYLIQIDGEGWTPDGPDGPDNDIKMLWRIDDGNET